MAINFLAIKKYQIFKFYPLFKTSLKKFFVKTKDLIKDNLSLFFLDLSNNFFLFLPLFFLIGIIFFVKNEYQFRSNLDLISLLFLSSLMLFLLVWKERNFFIISSCSIILAGSFYSFFYQNLSFSNFKVSEKSFVHTGKIYVDAVGQIKEINQFTNSKNNSNGVSLIIANPEIYRSEFSEKKNIAKKSSDEKGQKSKKINKKKVRKSNKIDQKINVKNSLEKNTKIYFDQLQTKRIKRKENQQKKEFENLTSKNSEIKNSTKNDKNNSSNQEKNRFKKALNQQKKYLDNFHNIENYLEIDRKFLDLKNNYQQVDWIKKDSKSLFPYRIKNISLTSARNNENLAVGDLIAFKAFLEPKDFKDFYNDFDYSLINKINKIDLNGYLIGDARIVKKVRADNLDNFFSLQRQKIEKKIFTHLQNDKAAIAISLLNGNQDYISQATLEKIRLAGLSHLLSISGFHLSLAAAIFFISIRFLLSRSEYLALNYDLKKIAAVVSIFASFGYLKIADSPISAERAFLVILFFLISLLFNEKINQKRNLMIAALILMVINPYQIFNISFQLSFLAVLVLINFAKKNSAKNSQYDKKYDKNFFKKSSNYFLEIIKISLIIQIFSAPFLLNSFQNFAAISFVANIFAIPLTSFVIMPLEFLSLFLMPLGSEELVMKMLDLPISLLISIADISLKIPYANFKTAFLPDIAVLIAVVGSMIFLLLESKLKMLGLLIFFCSFLLIKTQQKPDLIISPKQNFIAFFENEKLIFSNNYQANKLQKKILKKFNQDEFITLEGKQNQYYNCDEKNCYFEDKDKKIKILLIKKRQKISEICQKDFNFLINFSKKYQLPNCQNKNFQSIDNIDFFNGGGFYLFFNEGIFSLKTAY